MGASRRRMHDYCRSLRSWLLCRRSRELGGACTLLSGWLVCSLFLAGPTVRSDAANAFCWNVGPATAAQAVYGRSYEARLRQELRNESASVSPSLAAWPRAAFVSFVVPLITRRERHSSFVAVAHANHPSFICCVALQVLLSPQLIASVHQWRMVIDGRAGLHNHLRCSVHSMMPRIDWRSDSRRNRSLRRRRCGGRRA